MIATERLLLVPAEAAHYDALLDGDLAFARRFGWPLADGWLDFPESLPLAMHALAEGRVVPEWWMYLFRDAATGTLLGTGGFKGAPDAAGTVEIGYAVAPAWRGRGLATEAARALVAWAFTQEGVARVVAHTLERDNTSSRVLRRAGFREVGEVVDPDDGPVWCWEAWHPDLVDASAGADADVATRAAAPPPTPATTPTPAGR